MKYSYDSVLTCHRNESPSFFLGEGTGLFQFGQKERAHEDNCSEHHIAKLDDAGMSGCCSYTHQATNNKKLLDIFRTVLHMES